MLACILEREIEILWVTVGPFDCACIITFCTFKNMPQGMKIDGEYNRAITLI